MNKIFDRPINALSKLPGFTTIAIAIKEIKLIMSQKLVLGLVLLMLIVVVFTIGLAYSGKSGIAALEHTTIAVYIPKNVEGIDADNFRKLLADTNVVTIKEFDSPEKVVESIYKRENKAGIVVRGRDTTTGRYVVDLYIDNSNPATATFIFEVTKQAVQAVGFTTSRELLVDIWKNLSSIKTSIGGEIQRVDSYRQQLDESEKRIANLKERVNAIDINEMRTLLKNQGQRSESIKNSLAKYTDDLSDFSGELDAIFSTINDSKQKLSQYKQASLDAKSSIDRYATVLQSAQTSIGNIRQSMGNSAPQELLDAQNQINDARNQLQSSSQLLDSTQADIDSTLGQLDTMAESLSRVKEKLSSSDSSMGSLKEQLDSTFVDLNNMDLQLSSLGSTVDEVNILIENALETKNTVDANLLQSKELMNSFVNSLGNLENLSPEFLANPVIINKKAAFADVNTFTALVPALIAIVIMLTAMLLSAVSFMVEKNQGAYLRMILSTTSDMTLFAGKIIGQAVFATVEALLILFVAVLFFNVPINGSFLELLLGVVLVSLAFISIGLFITNFTKSQATTLLAGMVIMIPLIFLGGIVLPIELMNPLIAGIAQWLPLTVSTSILTEIIVKGNSIFDLGMEVALLAVLSLMLVAFTIMNKKFE
jgi:ABC-type multidrug transport system permease subunit